MRIIKYGFLALLALILVVITMANRQTVTLSVLPGDIAAFSGVSLSIELPLFLVVMIGIVGGLLIGFVWEWIRETKHRSEATIKAREARRLAREVEALKTEKMRAEGQDDVLALLDPQSVAR